MTLKRKLLILLTGYYECLRSKVCMLKLLTEEIRTSFCSPSDAIQAGSTLTYLNISVPLSGSPLPCRTCAI